MFSIFKFLSYGEFIRLIVCSTIDGVEYIIPVLLTPLAGDIFDIVGVIFALYMFGWTGLFSGLELVPGLDIIPINVINWIIWMIIRRNKDFTGNFNSRFDFEH